MSRFLVYALKCPMCGAVRYIGKSSSGMARPKAHKNPSMLRGKTHRTNWIRSLKAQGLSYIIAVLETVDNKEALNASEIRWIAHGRAQGWRLTNHTDGGDGLGGMKHSAETRAKMSASAKALPAEVAKRRGESLKGKPKSLEHKAKLSAARKGVPRKSGMKYNLNDEQRAKIAARNKSRVWTKEQRERLSAAHRGRVFSDEQRAAIGKANIGRVVSMKTRIAVAESNRRRARSNDQKSLSFCF